MLCAIHMLPLSRSRLWLYWYGIGQTPAMLLKSSSLFSERNPLFMIAEFMHIPAVSPFFFAIPSLHFQFHALHSVSLSPAKALEWRSQHLPLFIDNAESSEDWRGADKVVLISTVPISAGAATVSPVVDAFSLSLRLFHILPAACPSAFD